MHQILHDELSIRQTNGSRWFWAIAAILAIFGMLVFHQSYVTFIEAHYPTSFDQLALLHRLYGIYYGTLADSAQSPPARFSAMLAQFINMKGWTLPALGTVLALLFGPYRSVFAMANYLFLVLAGGVLLYALRRRLGTSYAIAALGLVLLSNSLYLYAGGLTDLRWDAVGLATFGIFYVALWHFGVESGPRAFGLIVLTFVLTVFTRSTSAVYGLCSVGVFGVICTVGWAWTRAQGWRKRWFATFRLGLALSSVFLLFLAIHWQEVKGYYIQLLLTPEDVIRLKEYGVGSRAGLVLYYAGSFWYHFRVMIIAGGILLAGHLMLRLLSIRPFRSGETLSLKGQLNVPVLIGASFIFGTLIPLSVYSPSPVVIGTLTIPLAVTLITLVAMIGPGLHNIFTRFASRLLHVGMLVIGCGFFVIESMSHNPWPTAMLDWARAQEALLSQLARDYGEPGGTVTWFTVSDGLNPLALEVLLYESGRYDQVPRITGTSLNLFALDEAEIRRRIEIADAVVVQRDFPATVPFYPSLISLRDTQSEWQPILDRGFVLRATAGMPFMTFGYYSRPAALAALTGPFGVEYDSVQKRLHDGWVWINANAAEASLKNFADAETPATLAFDAVPGTGGVAGLDLIIACANSACPLQHFTPDGPPPWHVRMPLNIPPGVTALRFTATVQQNAAITQQTTVPLARIGHLRLLWNDH